VHNAVRFLGIERSPRRPQTAFNKEITMAVLMIAEVEGQTAEGYDGMLAQMGEPMRKAKGFISHLASPTENRWRIIEVWETKEDATRWFAEVVHPNLPPGVVPRRTFHEVHALVTR
jgi:hypothetical protein